MQNSQEQNTELHQACQAGDLERVTTLLALPGIATSLNHPDGYGWTSLHKACVNGKTEIVRLLLDQEGIEGSLNHPDGYGLTSLHKACVNGKTEIVRLLLDQEGIEGSLNHHNEDGDTPLRRACANGKTEIVQLLLQHKGIKDSLNHPDKDGWTPLNVACHNGNVDIVQVLLRDPRIAPDLPQTLFYFVQRIYRNRPSDRTAMITALLTGACRRIRFVIQPLRVSCKTLFDSVIQSDATVAPKIHEMLLAARSLVGAQLTAEQISELKTLMGDDLGFAQIQAKIEAQLRKKSEITEKAGAASAVGEQGALAMLSSDTLGIIEEFVGPVFVPLVTAPEDYAASEAHAGGGAAAAKC
jgi:ankyrin repeat protein